MEDSTSMSDVNEDVLHEILIRLPDCKSAIRSSTVCKRWLSAVHNPNFIRSFNRRHNNSIMKFTFLCRWSEQLSETKTPQTHFHDLSFPADGNTDCLYFLPLPRRATILASSGSLLLLRLYNKELCVCNPLTKQWRLLPSLPHNTEWNNFGLIASSNEFKVVLAETDYTEHFRAKLFCSESQQWTEYAKDFPQLITCNTEPTATSSDGVLYWKEGNWGCKGMVAYDPAEGAAWYVGLPSDLGFSGFNTSLGTVRGRVRLSQLIHRRSRGCAGMLRVWELEDCRRAEWRLVHEARWSRPQNSAVLGFHPDNGDVVFVKCGTDVYEYDLVGGGAVEMVGRLPIGSIEGIMPYFQVFTLAHPPSWSNCPFLDLERHEVSPKNRKVMILQ